MATEAGASVRPALRPGAVVLPLTVVAATTLGVAAGMGRLAIALAGAAALAALVVAVMIGRRSFAWFLSVMLVVRPVADLTAGGGIGLPEVIGVGVLLSCGAWLFLHREELLEQLRHPLTLTILGLVIVAMLSAASSPTPMTAIPSATGIAAGAAVYLALIVLLSTGRMTLQHLVGTMAASAIVPVLYPLLGLVGVEVFHEKDGIAALRSVFFLSNNFSHFLVPFVLTLVALASVARGRTQAALCGLIAVLGVELVLTQTRGAWIAVVLGVLVIGAVLDRRLLAGVILFSVLLIAFVPSVTERVTSVVPDPEATRTESSLTWRFQHWAEVVPMTAESPITGIGLNQTERRSGKQPHNDVVLALVEMGVLGVVVYLGMLWAAIATGWRATRRVVDRALPVDPLVLAVGVAGFAYALAFAGASVGENLLDNVTTLWVLCPVLAGVAWIAHAPPGALTPPPGPGATAAKHTGGGRS